MIIGSNFKLSNRKFLDDRQQCEGIEELNTNINGYLYPLGFEVYCIREGKWYQNTSKDENIPFWEERKGGVGEGAIDANGIIADGEILSNKTWSSEYIDLVIDDIETLITENTDYIMEIEGRLEFIEGSLEWLDTFDGSYNSLTDKPTIPTKVSELINDSGFAIHSQLESSGIFELRHSHENMETLQGITEEKVRQWDNVEGAAKIDDIVIANNTTWSSEKIHTTFDNYATENYVKNEIANAQLRNENGESIDLSGFATKDDVPTRTSQLINDNSFITEIPSEYITEEELEEKGYLNKHQDISHLATKEELFSKDYNELTNKPTIPTNISELVNDSGFATTDTLSYYATKDELFSKDYNDLTNKPNIPSLDGYATEQFVRDEIAQIDVNGGGDTNVDLSEYATKEELKGYAEKIHEHEQYLTEHQSLEGYATETYVTNAIANAQLGGGGNSNVDLSGYATKEELNTKADKEHTHEEYLTEIPSEYITETELNAKNYLTEHQDISHLALKTELFSKDYNELTNKPSIPSIEGLATESFVRNEIANAQLGGDSGEIDLSGYATKDELNAKADVDDIPTNISQLTNDAGYITSIPSEYITETELNNKGYLTEHQNISHLATKSELFSKDYNDLTNKPNIPSIEGLATETYVNNAVGDITIPTKVSELTNDSNFITSIPSEYVTETELNAKNYLTSHQDISHLATKSELNAKADVSAIPTNTSQLTNDSNFITSIPSEYVTETELNGMGYLTSSDISHLATKDELHSHDNQEILDGITEEIINQWNDDNIDGGNASTVNGFSIWSGTQAEYDSISTKSDTTIYLIRE